MLREFAGNLDHDLGRRDGLRIKNRFEVFTDTDEMWQSFDIGRLRPKSGREAEGNGGNTEHSGS